MTQFSEAELAAWENWLPVRFSFLDGQPSVEWCYFGTMKLDDSFWRESITRMMTRPFNQLFRRTTSLETLAALYEQRPQLKPNGLIFHLSRCGSTLLSQMLASLPETVVLSEPEPFDDFLKTSVADADYHATLLRQITSAMGYPRTGEKQMFLKFDAWHMVEWRLIERAFPGVPWVFLYRDPVEILVSHQRHASSQMIPSITNLNRFGQQYLVYANAPSEEYGARVLAGICEGALEAIQSSSSGHLMNYSELPEAGWSRMPDIFNLNLNDSDIASLQSAGKRDAKAPTANFEPDTAKKQREASPELRAAAEQFVMPLYEKLEAIRTQTSE